MKENEGTRMQSTCKDERDCKDCKLPTTPKTPDTPASRGKVSCRRRPHHHDASRAASRTGHAVAPFRVMRRWRRRSVQSCQGYFCMADSAGGSPPQAANVYAQLLADASSVAPARSKVTDDDLDFEPASRPSPTAASPASPTGGSRRQLSGLPGSGTEAVQESGSVASDLPSHSGSLTSRSYGEVAAREDGRWGFAYPSKSAQQQTNVERGQDSGQAKGLEREYMVQVEAPQGAGLGPGWATRAPKLEFGSGSVSPRKGPRSSVSFGKAGYAPVHTATKLDIGDLEDVNDDAPFQSALKAEASAHKIDLEHGGGAHVSGRDEDWAPLDVDVPVPIKPWFRAAVAMIQMLVGSCCIQVGLKEEDLQCQATFCSLLVVCGLVQLVQSGVGVYMISRQVGAVGEEPRAVLWFLEVVLWISVLHAVVTNSCENLKLQATASLYLSASALLWMLTLASWVAWYNRQSDHESRQAAQSRCSAPGSASPTKGSYGYQII